MRRYRARIKSKYRLDGTGGRLVPVRPNEAVVLKSALAVIREAIETQEEHQDIFAAMERTCTCNLCQAVEKYQQQKKQND